MLGFDAVGRFALGQVPASLAIILTAQTGTFTVAANAATFSIRLSAAATSYSFSPNPVSFRVTLTAVGAAYVVNGGASTGSLVGVSLTGNFSVTGFESHYTWDHTNWLPIGQPSGVWIPDSPSGSPWMPIPTHAVEWSRPDGTQDVFRVFTSWGYGEFQITQIIPTVWELNGAQAVENNTGTIVVPYDLPSVWEYAGKIGSGGADVSTFDFFGGAHGNIATLGRVILVDGVDMSTLTPGSVVSGTSIYHVQSFRILLPGNNSISCGTMQVSHTFDTNGCLVRVDLNPVMGFEWYNVYTGMLPSGAFDQITFGNLAPETPLHPAIPATKDRGSQFSTYVGSSTTHPFGVRMTLPSGGPNSTGSWADSKLDCAFWIDQDVPKMYVTDISTDFAFRKTAFPRSSSTQYQIFKQGAPDAPNIQPQSVWTPDNDMFIPPPETN